MNINKQESTSEKAFKKQITLHTSHYFQYSKKNRHTN